MFPTLLAILCIGVQPVEEPVTARPTPVEEPESLTPEEIAERFKQRLILEQDPAFLAMFSECSFRYTGGGYRDREFKYRLFIPETAGRGEKLPLLLWLHGRGEAGDNNVHQLLHLSQLVFPPPRERSRFPFFLLAVQCPRENPIWTTSAAEADDMLNVAMAILQKTLAENPVDRDRIAVSGVSSGGNACWEIAFRHPEAFSGVAPLASSGADMRELERLSKVPVWAFHSLHDQGTKIESVRGTVSAIKNAGGVVHLTEIETHRHDCWHSAFQDYELLNWLLSQRRGEQTKHLPGVRLVRGKFATVWRRATTGWSWPVIAGQVGLPIVLLLALQRLLRKRKKQ